MSRPGVLRILAGVLAGFAVVFAVRAGVSVPGSRTPAQSQLTALIGGQRRATDDLRRQVALLRQQVDDLSKVATSQAAGEAGLRTRIAGAGLAAGAVALRGPGVRVVLDDSSLRKAPSGNVNDLVIHSSDVQAVVNGLWRAGAEAVAVNGQRVTAVSAALCVGNTLLINGTVHSPPYVVVGIGAVRERFEADGLVRRLHSDAASFGLRFSVSAESTLDAPGLPAPATVTFARPAP